MTKEREAAYQDVEVLRQILSNALDGWRFKLDCGHHFTFGHFFGTEVTIYNGKTFKINCSQCGY